MSPDALATDDAIKAADTDARWPAGQWWRAYGDEQLNRWIELAALGSPSLAIAAARVRQAKAMAGIAESAESLHDLRRQHPETAQLADGSVLRPG